MALSDHIGDIITAYKAKPKNERVNRILSHLKDAHAHALLDDQEHSPAQQQADARITIDGGACTCKPGMTDQHCPVHGRPL